MTMALRACRLRVLGACIVAGLVAAAPLDARADDLMSVIRFWEARVAHLQDSQAKGIVHHRARPNGAALATAMADAHAATNKLAAQINAYAAGPTPSGERAVTATMIEFCAAARRMDELSGPFADVSSIFYADPTAFMARVFHERVERDEVRSACAG
jgi:hypothetical protein